MNKNIHDIDNYFKEQLQQYEEEPPSSIWGKIDNDLNRAEAAFYKRKYVALRKSLMLAACMLCSLFVVDVLQKENIHFPGVYSETKHEPAHPLLGNPSLDVNNIINPPVTATEEEAAFTGSEGKSSQNAFQDISFSDYKTSRNVDTVESLTITRKIEMGLADNFSTSQNLAELITDEHRFVKSTANTNELSDPTHTKNKNNTHSFYLVPFISLDHLSGRFEQEYEYGDQDEHDVTKREKADLSNTVGILAEYAISRKISLQSGILLTTTFTSIASTEIRALQDNSGNYKFKLATSYGLAEITKTGTNPRTGDSILLNGATLRLQYFSFPVTAKYLIKQGKINIAADAGLALNQITGDRIEADYGNSNNREIETINKIEGLKKTFFSLNLGADFSYQINNKIAVGINPLVRYAMSAVNQGTPVKTYPVNIGLAALAKIKL